MKIKKINQTNPGLVITNKKRTNLNSRKFKRGLKKLKKEIAEIERSKYPDPIKMLQRFTI